MAVITQAQREVLEKMRRDLERIETPDKLNLDAEEQHWYEVCGKAVDEQAHWTQVADEATDEAAGIEAANWTTVWSLVAHAADVTLKNIIELHNKSRWLVSDAVHESDHLGNVLLSADLCCPR